MFQILKELENGQQHVEGECECILWGGKIHAVEGLTLQLITMEVGQLYELPPLSRHYQLLQYSKYTFLYFFPFSFFCLIFKWLAFLKIICYVIYFIFTFPVLEVYII